MVAGILFPVIFLILSIKTTLISTVTPKFQIPKPNFNKQILPNANNPLVATKQPL
ncbi:hypothetical protein B4065_1985 [Caldibacillus thermoamylovorans]|nr:hypothetical protein B4065_1985 [Caldibacillus thermoamylovorans]